MREFSLVYIIGTYPGLTTTFIDREIQAMCSQGVQVRVISVRKPQEPPAPAQEGLQRLTSYLLPLDWRTFFLSHVHFLFLQPREYLRTLFELLASPHPDTGSRLKTLLHFLEGVYAARVIGARPCDHLHAHFVDRAAIIALVAGRLLGIPYSLTAHANDIYVKPVLLPLKFSRARFVATCTAYNRQHLAQKFGLNSSLHCFHHGLDLQTYRSRQPSPEAGIPLITSVGQLKEKKGFGFLLQACRLLKDQGITFHCQIIGDGKLRRELEEQIHTLDLEGNVVLRGSLPHLAVIQEYQRSTLFVLPCITGPDGDRDGIPNVILEAMAMRLPVVSTQHSGIPEVVVSGMNGLLVPPSDPEALAGALAMLLNDSSLRTQLGACGQQTVIEQFDATRNTAKLLQEMIQA